MISSYLRDLKEKSKMSIRELSDKTGIPECTLNRIINGQTDNPGFQNVADIVIALGGSLDDIAGIPHPPAKMPDEVNKLYALIISANERLEALNHAIEHIQHILAIKDKWIQRMFVYCCVITFMLVAYLIVDAMLPNFGIIKR